MPALLTLGLAAHADTLPPPCNPHGCAFLPAIVAQTGYTQGGNQQIALNVWVDNVNFVHFNRLMEDSSHNLLWDSDGGGQFIVHPGGGQLNYAYCAPALLAMPDGRAMTVIYRIEGADNYQPYLQFFPFNNGSQQVDASSHPAQYSYRTPEGGGQAPFTESSFAAANLPDGTGFVTVRYSDNTKLYVDYWRWADFPGLKDVGGATFPADAIGTKVQPYFSTTIALPGGLTRSHVNGTVAMAITTNYDRMARWYPFRLTVAISPGNGSAVQVREWRLNNQMPKTSLPGYFLTSPPRDKAWHAVGSRSDALISMTDGMDGAVYLGMLNRPSTANDGNLEFYKRDGYDYTTQSPTWSQSLITSAVNTHREVPVLFYRPEDWASPQYNAATGTFPTTGQIAFPVTQLLVYNYDADYSGMGGPNGAGTDAAQSDYTCAIELPFAMARRRPLEDTAENVAGNVVGIFEGPPPLPNENIPLGDNVYYEQAAVIYGTTQSSQSDFTSSLKAGISVGFKVTGGFKVLGMGAEASLDFQLNHTWGSATSTTSGVSREGTMSENSYLTTDSTGKPIVNPQGTLFIQKQTFTGFAYEMLAPDANPTDPNATVLDGSRVFFTRYPSGEYVKAVDYWINPNAVQPGVLESYVATPQERSQLNARAIPFGDGSSSSIPFSWTKQSQAKSSFNAWAESSDSHSATLDVSISLGFSLNTPAVDIDSSVGTNVTTEREWSTSRNAGFGLQISNFYVPVDTSVPGTYQSYAFATYLLADSNDFTKELLSQDPDSAGLVTQTWPTDPKMRRDNEAVREQILASSRPWKVTYILNGPPSKVLPLGGLAAAARLDPALAAKLARMGVTNTAQLELLLHRMGDDSNTPVSPGPVSPVRLLGQAGANAGQAQRAASGADTSGALRSPASVRNRLRAISPSEAATLRRLLADMQAARMREYGAKNPRVYPRVPPPSVVNAPDYRSPFAPLFTATPPPGL